MCLRRRGQAYHRLAVHRIRDALADAAPKDVSGLIDFVGLLEELAVVDTSKRPSTTLPLSRVLALRDKGDVPFRPTVV